MIGRRWGGATRRACGALAALAALGGGLTACGGSSSTTTTAAALGAAPASASSTGADPASAGSTGPNPANATSTGADPTTSSTSSAASKPAGVASPGSKFAVGQAATVAYTPVGASAARGKSSTLLVTVQSFQKGSLSDFNGIQLDATQKASTPYYVKVHVKNLGPSSIDVDGTAAAIEGVDSTGNNQQSVTFIGEFPRCPDHASTTPLGPGRSYDDCLTFLIPGGISKISYNGTTDYIDSPVTWAPN